MASTLSGIVTRISLLHNANISDHLVNDTELDGDYDFTGDGYVNGKDVILLSMII